MRDFNFFQSYIKEPEKTDIKGLIVKGFATIISFVIIIYPIINFFEIRGIQKEIFALSQVIESTDNIEKIKAIDEKKLEILQLKKEKMIFDKLKEKLEEKEIISDLLIYEILWRIPSDISFDSLNINENEIEVQGKTTHKFNIAQMEYNLRNSIYIDEVFIPSIIENNRYYDFTIRFKAKDVATNGIE